MRCRPFVGAQHLHSVLAGRFTAFLQPLVKISELNLAEAVVQDATGTFDDDHHRGRFGLVGKVDPHDAMVGGDAQPLRKIIMVEVEADELARSLAHGNSSQRASTTARKSTSLRRCSGGSSA